MAVKAPPDDTGNIVDASSLYKSSHTQYKSCSVGTEVDPLCTWIPENLGICSGCDTLEFTPIRLSATSNVCVLRKVSVPVTVKLPLMVTDPPKSVVEVVVNVVNLPVPAVVAPILTLLIEPVAVEAMLTAPAGLMVTVPVPVGDNVTVWLDVIAEMLPAKVEVTPAVPKVNVLAGAIDTVPVPVGDNVTVLLDPVKLKSPDRVVLPVTPSVLLNDAAFAIVVVAAVTVTTSVLSVMIAIDPVPVSVTVTAELPA